MSAFGGKADGNQRLLKRPLIAISGLTSSQLVGYGSTIKFYYAISTDEAEHAFLEFCRARDEFAEFVGKHDLKDLFEQLGTETRGEEYLRKIVEHAKNTRRLLSNLMKPERERKVCRAFLRCFGVEFDEEELISQRGEPVDVGFRDAGFQIIELMEKERRRGDEWREREKKYQEAESMDNVLESHRPPLPISLSEIIRLLSERLEGKAAKYRDEDIDVLAYINLSHEYLDPNSSWRDVDRGGGLRLVSCSSPDV